MKVLKNAFTLLEMFLNSNSELSLEELASLSGLNKSNISRIMADLVEHGYIIQREKRGKYSLGYKYFDFTGYIKNQMKIRDIAVPYLVKLAQVADESVMLTIWNGGKATVTETFNANHPLKVVPDEGTGLPLHSSSLGKVILSNITTSEFNEIYKDQTLERYTPNTITDLEDLKKHLIIVQREGVAFDDEEDTPGVRSIAAVLKGFESSVVGSIGVVGPSVRLTRIRLRELVEPVKKCANSISRALGNPN